MNNAPRVNLPWTVVAASAVALVAIGAGAAYVTLRSNEPSAARVGDEGGMSAPGSSGGVAAPGAPASTTTAGGEGALPDVIVTLSPDAAARAGITMTPVTAGIASVGIRLPGVVEPNAYKQVAVTPLIAGRITSVLAGLGDQVRQGQTLAEIFSPELADAQTRYISARAGLGAHERELNRTEALVEVGAASRQELERIHAEHAARSADVEGVRSRLELLGMPAAAIEGLARGTGINASTVVPAPISGVITDRLANVGLNVDPTAKLFTVVDLSTVWVVADLYERDFSRVRVGSPTSVTTTAYPDTSLQGHVSYIDPQVSPQTRTAKVRIEVPNARHELRLGMYVDVLVGSSGEGSVAFIPRTAVQNVGDRQVVYLVDQKEAGTFIERTVRLGQPSGEHVEVLSGVSVGDVVVAQGSFFMRAERERLGL